MRLHRSLIRDENGATAIEFALLVLPFFALVFAILEVALMFFIDSTLDAALQRTAREVRIGTAASEGWDLADFKAEVCANMVLAFECTEHLLVRTVVMTDFSSATLVSGVSGNVISVTESFSAGASSDYMLIQAFLPWDSVLGFAGVNAHTLADGSYVLAAASLFRNEPF